MDVHYACDNCETELVYRTDRDDSPEEVCPNCGFELDLHNNFHSGNHLKSCMVCGGEDFYESRQINPYFGFSLIIVGSLGFLCSIYFIPGMNGFLWGVVILLSLAVIDRVLRLSLPEAFVCYRCSSVYQGVNPAQEFEEFDHELAAELKHSDN